MALSSAKKEILKNLNKQRSMEKIAVGVRGVRLLIVLCAMRLDNTASLSSPGTDLDYNSAVSAVSIHSLRKSLTNEL